MDQRQRTKRFGISVILCACILRLSMAGIPGAMLRQFLQTGVTSILTYLETGRNVRFSASQGPYYDFFRESPAPWMPPEKKPTFLAEDAAFVKMDYDCSSRPDLEDLMEQPLNWDLTAQEPSVLILHTHTTESYTKEGENYVETSAYRTLDEKHNMLSIGDAVAQMLIRNGIGVIHDRNIHDYPSYTGSYVHARESAEDILEQYPSICLVLDLHRDALEKQGKQIRFLSPEDTCAQLMMVVGTDVSRRSHKNWRENLSLALKLHVLLERISPGIMRPLNLRSERFNQDLSPGALLVEVGAAGNTHAEALAAAQKLAEALIILAEGSDNS